MEAILKQLKNLPTQKELFSFILITALSLSVWFLGPLIAIANTTPLQQPEKRFYIISLIFLTWFLKIYFFSIQPRQIPFVVTNLELVKKIQALEEKFAGFIDFLKKTIISKHGNKLNLISLPWFLVIGPSNSGKTSLLANANINFLLSKKFNPDALKKLSPSSSCDWWVTRDLVLVDVPGAFLSSSPKKIANSRQLFPQSNPSDVLWRSFINLIKKFRGKESLSGIVITLSLSDLLSPQKQNREHSIHSIKKHIRELRAQFGEHLPFYLTITKCDMLPGFLEFFSDSGSDETSQMWGISIPTPKENESLVEAFSNRFNTLIKRLNSQLICRLHQERNSEVRSYIKDFPVHIERLKTNLGGFLQFILNSEKNFRLQSVFLTSAVQCPLDEPLTHPHTANMSAHQLMPSIPGVSMPSKPYFIRQLLLQGLLPVANQQPRASGRSQWQHRPVAYAISVASILVTAFFLGDDFHHSIKQTSTIQDSLNQLQAKESSKDMPLANSLPLLDALEQTANSTHTWFFQSGKVAKTAKAAYQSALQNFIFSEVKNDLETYLQNTYYKNSDEIYSALKAYMMLNQTEKPQPEFIISTLQQVTPALFANQNSEKIIHHLRVALNSAWQPIELDPAVVDSVRKHLTSQSPAELGYAILKNLVSTLRITDTDKNLQSFTTKIPGMYTASAFETIYNQQIEKAAIETMQGNAVLGKFSTSSVNNTPLIEQLRNMYVSNYVNAWENLLNNTQISTPKNLKETDALIASLTTESSPLLRLLKTIKQNTAFAPITSASVKLAALNVFLNNTGIDNTAKLTVALQHLHIDLQKILGASEPGNAAFQAAAARMIKLQTGDPITQLHSIADGSPEPLKTWINNIAAESWRFTLQDAGHYIENRWQTDIMTTYHAQFANHFPFALESAQETPLDQFSKLLNPQGTLTHFYQKFLRAFVDNSDKKLQWKKVENEQIPFSITVLAELQQAQQIQSIFFPDLDSKVSIKFTLQPLSLSPNTKSIAINIDGQTFQFDKSQPHIPQTLNWPGNKVSHLTTLNLITANKHPINSQIPGDWGWFRLVSTSLVKPINQRELLLNFDVYGYQAKYFLFTHGPINPFLILQDFKLPDQL